MRLRLASVQRFFKQAVTERLGLKLIAMVITVLLLTLVRFQEESERFFDVEIVPHLPDPITGMAMTSGLPKTVRVRLAGPSSVINSLSPGEIPPLEVDLRNRRLGTSHFYLTDEMFEQAFSHRSKKLQFVRVVRAIPESVQIKMEELVSRDLPVRINTLGRLQDGMELDGKPMVTPDRLTVVGPLSAMRGLKAVETEDVVVEGMGQGEHLQTVAAIPIEGLSIRGGEELYVVVKVRHTPVRKLFSDLPLEVQGTELVAETRPTKVTVALTGPKVVLNALPPDKVRPVVVIEKEQAAVPGVYQEDVTISWLPDAVKVTSLIPSTVRVALSHAGAGKTKKKDQ